MPAVRMFQEGPVNYARANTPPTRKNPMPPFSFKPENPYSRGVGVTTGQDRRLHNQASRQKRKPAAPRGRNQATRLQRAL